MEVMIILFVAIAIIGSMTFWVWSLVDILRSNFKKESDKIIWLVVVLTLHLLGSILYYLYGVKQKEKQLEDLV